MSPVSVYRISVFTPSFRTTHPEVDVERSITKSVIASPFPPGNVQLSATEEVPIIPVKLKGAFGFTLVIGFVGLGVGVGLGVDVRVGVGVGVGVADG